MTLAVHKFCQACGATLRAGMQFCEACGAPVAMGSEGTSEAFGQNTACRRCGAAILPGRYFCVQCGAALVDATPVVPARAERTALSWQVFVPAAMILAVGVAIVLMRGSGNGTGIAPNSTPGSGAPVTGAPKAVVYRPDPIPYELPPGQPAASLGPSDEDAADALREELAKFADLAGMEIYVFPVIGPELVGLLVIDIDTAKSGSLSNAFQKDSSMQGRLIQTVASNAALKHANVQRLAMNFHGQDKDGPYTVIVTLSFKTLADIAGGKQLTQQESNGQILLQVKRGGP